MRVEAVQAFYYGQPRGGPAILWERQARNLFLKPDPALGVFLKISGPVTDIEESWTPRPYRDGNDGEAMILEIRWDLLSKDKRFRDPKERFQQFYASRMITHAQRYIDGLLNFAIADELGHAALNHYARVIRTCDARLR